MARMSRIEHRFQYAGRQQGSLDRNRGTTGQEHLLDIQRQVGEVGVGTVFVFATVTLGEEFRGNNFALADTCRIGKVFDVSIEHQRCTP